MLRRLIITFLFTWLLSFRMCYLWTKGKHDLIIWLGNQESVYFTSHVLQTILCMTTMFRFLQNLLCKTTSIRVSNNMLCKIINIRVLNSILCRTMIFLFLIKRTWICRWVVVSLDCLRLYTPWWDHIITPFPFFLAIYTLHNLHLVACPSLGSYLSHGVMCLIWCLISHLVSHLSTRSCPLYIVLCFVYHSIKYILSCIAFLFIMVFAIMTM